MPPPAPQPPTPDGGWGWVVVGCAFLALVLGYGPVNSVGVLYPEWLHEYEEGKAMTAWVGSLVGGIGLVMGPVCSACVVSFGVRPATVFSGLMLASGFILSVFAPNVTFLIFSYGILVGVGSGLLYTATLTITCLYFEKRRGLALGIIMAGTSVGGFVFATLQNELIKLFGLDGCLLIVGALVLHVLACAGPMRPLNRPKYHLRQRGAILERAAEEQRLQEEEEPSNQETTGKDPDIAMETKEQIVRGRSGCSAFSKMMEMKMRQCVSSMLSLCQDRVVMALCVSLFLFSLGNYPPQIFLEDLAQTWGLTEDVASISLVSLNSIGAGVGKLGLGVMADLPWVDSVFLYALTVAVSGLGVTLLPLIRSYLGLQVMSLVLGFLSGNWTLIPYVTTQLVGVEKLTEAHGILMSFGGVALMLGPPVVGSFYDFTQSFDVAFHLSGGCMMTGSLILVLTAVVTRKKQPSSSP